VRAPVEAPGLVDEAFRQLLNGRPRPVGLECPMDVWAKRAAVALPDAPATRGELPLDEDAIEAAATLLGGAERPLIVVGGGAQAAGAEVSTVANLLQAPVCALRMGHGVLDARHPLAVNGPVGYRLWARADAVLAVGTRLQTQQMNWGIDDELAIVRVDVDPDELARVHPPAVGIVGDAAPVLARLAERLARHNRRRTPRTDEIEALRAQFWAGAARLQPQLAYLEAIRAELPEDGVLVDELTQVGYVARFAYPVYAPRTFITPGYQGTLGWGLATALLVKAARPDVPVVSIAGDGGFMFNVQELATAVRHGLAVVAIVFDDGAYGNVRRILKEQMGNRLIASDLVNPDFVRLAESFGIAGYRARSPDELRTTLHEALKLEAPALIEVPCGEMPSPWEFVLMPRARGHGPTRAIF
jgi:acetolactate synthase-1/2/3 large subunit